MHISPSLAKYTAVTMTSGHSFVATCGLGHRFEISRAHQSVATLPANKWLLWKFQANHAQRYNSVLCAQFAAIAAAVS
jgi:hypothetical protein